MVYKITYLMKLYFVPLCLVVNNDQTRIRLIPIVRERTWKSKGTKHIQVLRVEDNKQVSMVVFFITNGCLLPIQVIFTSIMHICSSPSNGENLSALDLVGILHSMKIIGLHCRQQKTLLAIFCSST